MSAPIAAVLENIIVIGNWVLENPSHNSLYKLMRVVVRPRSRGSQIVV